MTLVEGKGKLIPFKDVVKEHKLVFTENFTATQDCVTEMYFPCFEAEICIEGTLVIL